MAKKASSGRASTTRRRTVALLVETSNAYARRLLDGVVSFVRGGHDWSLLLVEQGRGGRPPAWIDEWSGDGIIARVENRPIAEAVGRAGLPTVDVSAARLLPELPCVETDDAAIAGLAFEHLRSRALTSLAFYGDARFRWSIGRRDAFVRLARQAGLRCDVLDHPHRQGTRRPGWRTERRIVRRWLHDLPKPVGIFACFDSRGQYLLDVCRDSGLRVPDEVAVVGVDNDELLCELSDPPLSSVAPDACRTGFIAAQTLSRMMDGRRTPPAMVRIAPLRVVARQSTDTLAVDHPDIRAAASYLRQHAFEGIDVSDMIRELAVSRRALESRFRRLVGRSPHEELMRLRMTEAQRLLAGSDEPLQHVAELCGLRSGEYLNVAFRRYTGTTPGAYRRAHRHAAARFMA